MLKKPTTLRCACGKDWCAISVRASGLLHRCFACWLRGYLLYVGE